MLKTSPSNAGNEGLIPGWGAKIPHASGPKNQNKRQKQYCNKFNKDFKNGPHQKKKISKKLRLRKKGIIRMVRTRQMSLSRDPKIINK